MPRTNGPRLNQRVNFHEGDATFSMKDNALSQIDEDGGDAVAVSKTGLAAARLI